MSVRYETDGAVAVVTLDRPDKLNAMTLAMYDALGAAYRRARDDDAVRAIVLTGAGERAFSVGADLTESIPALAEDRFDISEWDGAHLKGVGLYLFDLQVFDAIRRTPRTAMRDEYEITDSIQVMIDDGHVVRSTDAVHDDLNVTYPEDLLWINLALARREHGGILVADSARVEAGAKIENTVIGARVDVPAGACVTNSLVFDDVRIAPNAVIDSAIVTPRQILKCQLPR